MYSDQQFNNMTEMFGFDYSSRLPISVCLIECVRCMHYGDKKCNMLHNHLDWTNRAFVVVLLQIGLFSF